MLVSTAPAPNKIHLYLTILQPLTVQGKRDGEPPRGYEFLADLPGDVRFEATTPPDLTLHHLINADMLVATGSSFPMLAAVLGMKPVVLATVSKEALKRGLDNPQGFYETSDIELVDREGNLLTPLSVLRSKVVTKYHWLHDSVFPCKGS